MISALYLRGIALFLQTKGSGIVVSRQLTSVLKTQMTRMRMAAQRRRKERPGLMVTRRLQEADRRLQVVTRRLQEAD